MKKCACSHCFAPKLFLCECLYSCHCHHCLSSLPYNVYPLFNSSIHLWCIWSCMLDCNTLFQAKFFYFCFMFTCIITTYIFDIVLLSCQFCMNIFKELNHSSFSLCKVTPSFITIIINRTCPVFVSCHGVRIWASCVDEYSFSNCRCFNECCFWYA